MTNKNQQKLVSNTDSTVSWNTSNKNHLNVSYYVHDPNANPRNDLKLPIWLEK